VTAGPEVLRRFRTDERGSGYIGAFIVLFAFLVVGGVGVLVDSARQVSTERFASSAAYEAARAGAQAIQVTGARGGAATIDASGARAAALDAATGLLSGSGATVTNVTVTGDEVVVTVSRHVDSWFPIISPRTVVETGRARIVTGITQEGQ
jgi:hypothetical protein